MKHRVSKISLMALSLAFIVNTYPLSNAQAMLEEDMATLSRIHRQPRNSSNDALTRETIDIALQEYHHRIGEMDVNFFTPFIESLQKQVALEQEKLQSHCHQAGKITKPLPSSRKRNPNKP